MVKIGKPEQLIILKQEATYNSMLEKISKGESVREYLKVSKVAARLNNVEIQHLNSPLVPVALYKIINDTFEYFNTQCSDGLIGLLIDDILDVWKRFSLLEIVKAITEGRQSKNSFYGKLNAGHFMTWISLYDLKMQEELTRFRSNENRDYQNNLRNLEFPKELMDAFTYKKKPSNKPELTQEQKVSALGDRVRVENVSSKESARRERIRQWNLEKTGMTLKEWMEIYDRK